MQLQDIAAARAVVEPVDILGDQRESRGALLECHQRVMRRVWFRGGDLLAAPVVPFPNQARVALECFGRGKLLGPELVPQTARTAKGRDAALGGDAGASQHDDRFSGSDPLAGLFHKLIIIASK